MNCTFNTVDNRKSRFRTNKAFIMIGIVAIVLSILVINLWNDPRGTVLGDEYPVLNQDTTDSANIESTESVISE